jgi:hypothetical protein
MNFCLLESSNNCKIKRCRSEGEAHKIRRREWKNRGEERREEKRTHENSKSPSRKKRQMQKKQ